jgi:citrate synthase
MVEREVFWRSRICQIGPKKWNYHGYPNTELMGRISFGTMVYLMFKGELPEPRVGRLMDAILISMCDFGVLAPSVAAARFAASGRPELVSAICSGLLALGKAHGATIGEAMEVFYGGVERLRASGKAVEEVAEEIVREHRRNGRYIPGYGSPSELGADDPNPVVASRVRGLAKVGGLYGDYVRLSEAVEKALEKVVINLDGANGAVLCEMGFEPRVGEAIFCLSRSLGLAAEALEEFSRERPFRQVPYTEVLYDGMPERPLPPGYREGAD